MSNCKKCGREDGHWIGCESAPSQVSEGGATDEAQTPPPDTEMCAYRDCAFQRRPKGKGPAPKYCEEHSDPKNRK